MYKHLCPNWYVTTILQITPALLERMGVKGIICDLDNTIIPWDGEEVSEEMINWFAVMKMAGFRLCLLSNGLQQRVNTVSKTLDIKGFPAAIKPRKRAFLQAVDHLGLAPTEIVVIGDQLFTDILGGNRLGLQTILVQPMAEKELFWTRFVRKLEKVVLKRITVVELTEDTDSFC